MKRTNQTDINTEAHWNEVYLREYRSGKRRVDDDRRDFVYNAISNRLQFIPNIKNPSILDVGSGSGELLTHIHATFPFMHKVGVDHSNVAIRLGQQDNPGFEMHCASAYALPFEDNWFQSAVCMETLEHLEDPQYAVAELVRVTVPNGNLVLSVPFMDANPSDEHLYTFDISSALALTEKYGKVRDLRVLAGGLSICWNTQIIK